MKLFRFELKSEPGVAKSGMVFAGKVYETDGANAVAVHEAEAVRPLAPVPLAPSVRIYEQSRQPSRHLEGSQGDEELPHFYYANPAILAGPSQVIPYPVGFGGRAALLPMAAAISVSSGYHIDLADADETILGLTLMAMVYMPEVQAHEDRRGGGYGRSIDAGSAIGPVVTTPDELEDFLVDQQFGRRYGLNAVIRVNGVERASGNLETQPWTFAEAIWGASRSCVVKEGDVFAMGPICDLEEPLWLDSGDEVQLAVENLGTLSLRLSEDL